LEGGFGQRWREDEEAKIEMGLGKRRREDEELKIEGGLETEKQKLRGGVWTNDRGRMEKQKLVGV
jgi:hypothetical protein